MRGGDDGAEALLKAHAERAPGAAGGVDHLVRLAHLDREGLLDEDMCSGLERSDREHRMRWMRRAHDDDVRRTREELAMVDKPRATRLGCERRDLFRDERADAHELDVAECSDRLQVERGDHPGADHAVAKLHASSRSAATQSRVASSPLPSRW